MRETKCCMVKMVRNNNCFSATLSHEWVNQISTDHRDKNGFVQGVLSTTVQSGNNALNFKGYFIARLPGVGWRGELLVTLSKVKVKGFDCSYQRDSGRILQGILITS